MKSVSGIILAAGKGTRMKSPIPKVLHEVDGHSMLEHVYQALSSSGVSNIVVVLGGDLDNFDSFLNNHSNVSACVQENRLGTGDAVAAAAPCYQNIAPIEYSSNSVITGGNISSDYVIICAGDTPAIQGEVLSDFINTCIESSSDIGVLGMKIPDPTGYGRLVVNDQQILKKIVEQKDADEETQKIDWVNSGVIFAKQSVLFECLREITPNNVQKEYYLTDCIEIAQKRGLKTTAYKTKNWQDFSGVNNLDQKAAVESYMLSRVEK